VPELRGRARAAAAETQLNFARALRRGSPWIFAWGPLLSGCVGAAGAVGLFFLARENEPADVTSTAAVGEVAAGFIGLLLALTVASIGIALWTRDGAVGVVAGGWAAVAGFFVALGLLAAFTALP
jgi:hypothetical protein